MHRESAGRYLNVLRYNRLYTSRRTVLPGPGPGSRKVLSVWTFGGSTMFGWGLPDDQTIPSWLDRELASRYPDREVRVVNFGPGSYFSSLELAQYLALLRTESSTGGTDRERVESCRRGTGPARLGRIYEVPIPGMLGSTVELVAGHRIGEGIVASETIPSGRARRIDEICVSRGVQVVRAVIRFE